MLLAKKDFRENLKYVKDKKGEVIDSITEKCSLNTQYAQAYTEALFDEIREATLDRKLCLLFLIDSILKHCKKAYQEFIQKGIIDVFCNAYEASKDRPEIRKELRFLFKVWELYFSHTTLMSIDASLKLKLGEDINTSLSAEELDHIIAHYRKIKEDPNHLELQKALLMRTAPPKVPKKEKKEKEESSLYVPDDIKNRLEANAAPEKKVKTIRPKPPATDAPKQNVNGSAGGVVVKKPMVGELPPKRPDGEPKLRKVEGDVLLKKVEGKPPIPRKPENEIANKKMEVEAPLKKAEAPTAVRKLSKGDPGYTIKKKSAPTRREKASIDSDEQALGAKRKIIKVDQEEVKNISEAPPVERRKLPTGIPKPPEDSRVASRRENMMHTDRDIPEKPLNSNLDQEPMKRFPPSQHQPPRQLEQSRSFEEQFEAGAFSDDESNQIPTKQPATDSGYIQNSMNPNFHQQSHMQQPPHVQPPHMRQPGQHPHYQYQQNPQFPPQPHFQGPPQNPQSQYPRPHFRNANPEQGQGYPPVNQFQQPSQLQPFPQGHHSQTHPPGPSHFQSQPQFPNQPEDHYQNRPFNPQRQQQQQHHGYNQFPIPFQSQEPSQGQFRPNMAPEQGMNTMNPQFAEQAPRNEDKLLEIRNMLMTSRRPGPEPIRPPQDFNPDLQLLSTTRKDSFPDPRNFQQTPEVQFYDQGNALVFRSLLQGIKRELPGSVKAKYEHKLGRMISLSEMVMRRDFNVVESLYERLPYRCSSCGMRFANRTPLDKHLDNHLRFNMEQKEKTKTMNLREQLITTEHWIKDEGHKNYKTANIENGEDDFEFENYVPTSEDQRSCKACGETFKEVWDKDKETWLLDTATKVKYKEEEASDEAKQKNGVSYDLMHFRCYKLCLQIESK